MSVSDLHVKYRILNLPLHKCAAVFALLGSCTHKFESLIICLFFVSVCVSMYMFPFFTPGAC